MSQAGHSSIQMLFCFAKMLVGLCPNPSCSASCRCRLRVCSKRFYNKTKRQDQSSSQRKDSGLSSFIGTLFSALLFLSVRPDHIAGRGEAVILPSKSKGKRREGGDFLQCRQHIEHRPYYKGIGYWEARIPTAM